MVDTEIMAKTMCLMCRGVFNTENSSEEQVDVGDENFCPSCWERHNIKLVN